MSVTLGEKLRQARESRGLSISEVAEQTRISALYLECIENDDYRTLPGGIFNKGFVKSFAKVVGIDENEALQDYTSLIANQGTPVVEETARSYRPEVLTDDRSAASSMPTILLAGVILALMTIGILVFLNYYNTESIPTANSSTNTNVNANTAANIVVANTNTAPTSNAPTMANLKVEFKALNGPASVTSTTDGKRLSGNITPETPRILEPKQSLRLSYAKAQVKNVEMLINDKKITLPETNGNRNVIDFEINAENLAQIWESGQIAVPPVTR